jgi:hypothetical protein
MQIRYLCCAITFGASLALVEAGCSDNFGDCLSHSNCQPDGSPGGAGAIDGGGVGGSSGTSGASGTGGASGASGTSGAGNGGTSSGSSGSSGTSGTTGTGGSPPCNGACTGATPVCNDATDQCVQCLQSNHCSGAKSVCKTATNTCVECIGNTDCVGDKRFCDAASNSCVTCLGNTACATAMASRCDAGECKPCSSNTDCAHISGKAVCSSGECVQCTPTEASACGANPCNPVTKRCSAHSTNRRPCDACDTDANCATPNHFCVPMRYKGSDRPGGYCLKETTSAGGCTRPFTVPLTARTSLSGITNRTYCGINETLATCEAVRARLDDQACPGGLDSECPQGGICRTVGVTSNTCTYACGEAAECVSPPSPSSTCGTGIPPTEPTYCGG